MQQSEFIEYFKNRYPHQENFLATVTEISHDIIPYLQAQQSTKADYDMVVRMFEPERTISFKVVWENDQGELEYNTGYRVQLSSARGPYKGGLRFDASVNEDVLKFLALEQTFKNALTGLPLGSGKGGSDFNPRGRSEAEVKRFCQSFITELYRYIGAETDVPAGDIGVGGREIGYMYGQYQRIVNAHSGILTGKGVDFGGSCGRTEATGYGVVYLAEHILNNAGQQLAGKTAVVSGSGNVAIHVAEKLIEKGAQVLTLSDRKGYMHSAAGITADQLEDIKIVKSDRGLLVDYAATAGMDFVADDTPWQSVEADLYFPCATQNEIEEADAQSITKRGAILLCEGANMPSTNEAVAVFQDSQTIFVPAKAANAGGVAVSGLEMSQNSGHDSWSSAQVDERLQLIMSNIFETMQRYGIASDGSIDYARGANVGGFVKVFNAMKGLGW